MKTSEAGIEFVANHEGWVNHVYKDIANIDTIGYGHVVKPGEAFPPIITKERGLSILASDLGFAESAVNKGVKVIITQNQFDALVSFTFNMGGGAFTSSTLLKKLNAGDVACAADEILRWDHTTINGKLTQAAGLTKRRKEERAVFLTPDTVVEAEAPPAAPSPDPVVVTPSPVVILVPAPVPVVEEPKSVSFFGFIMMIINMILGRKK